jgi:hypothetical protein
MPNDPYMGRTAPLTSKHCILYIYSTNIGTEYFKPALHSPFFFSSKCRLFHNANFFGSCIIDILYIGCTKIKKNNSGAKGLMPLTVHLCIADLFTLQVQANKHLPLTTSPHIVSPSTSSTYFTSQKSSNML